MDTGLEELETVQDYIQTLFNELPIVDLEQSVELSTSLIGQNVIYGKKIIELSDKFTAKYRKDHFCDRRDIEQKISQIHSMLCSQPCSSGLDEMVSQILVAVGEERVSYPAAQSRGSHLPVSRTASLNPCHQHTIKDSKIECNREQADPIEQNSSGVRREKNLTKNKVIYDSEQAVQKRRKSVAGRPRQTASKKQQPHQINEDFTTKNALQLKSKFQEQVEAIKMVFEELNKAIRGSGLRISEQNSHFSKEVSDEDKENLKDFAMANIENNTKNIQKLSNLVGLVEEHLEKKIKIEGFAQGKFKVYTEEISKRKEVFSFAVSKMLENLADLRQNIVSKSREAECLNLVDSLEDIGNQFYELYPSHQIIKDLRVDKIDRELEKIGFKSYGCQVSIGKSEKAMNREMVESKRNLLELYKVTTRLGQTIDRFQKSIKFKKQIDQKEVEKLVEAIRDSFPRKNIVQMPNSVSSEVGAYQDDLRRILDQNQKMEKEANEEFLKKNRKNQKKLQELERTIEDLILQVRKEQQAHESTKKKVTRKLQAEKQENKNLSGCKKELQKQIKQLSRETNHLKDNIKEEYRKCDELQHNLERENQLIRSQLMPKEEKIMALEENYRQESTKWEEEREIYHQKIVLLEAHEESSEEEMAKLKVELGEMIKQNEKMKEQILELTDLYEENLREQKQLINSVNELEKEVKGKKLAGKEMKEKMRIIEEINKNLQKDKERCFDEIKKWESAWKEKEEESQKFRQLGVLNDSDIEMLKEEMDKVKQAYLEAQEQLEDSKAHLKSLQNEKDHLLRETKKLKRDAEEANSRWQNNTLNKQRMEKDVQDLRDELALKNKQYSHLLHEIDELKREGSKLKKQNQELRQNCIKFENELRTSRQDQHRKFDNQSVEAGKRKLELEGLKVELRRKSEQCEKMRESYDEKLQVLESKNKELSQFITQKQMLARINNSHMSG